MDKYLYYKNNILYYKKLNLYKKFNNSKTPLYIFLPDRLEENIKTINKLDLTVFYAYKANYFKPILDILKKYNIGIEVMGENEIFTAIKNGFSGKNIMFNGTGRSENILKFAIKNNVFGIVVDNIEECKKISEIVKNIKKNLNIFIRIYPFLNTCFNPISFIKRNYKLGIQTLSELNKILKIIKSNNQLILKGINFHFAIRQKKDYLYKKAFKKTFQLFNELKKDFKDLSYISIGGGYESKYLMERHQQNINNIILPIKKMVKRNVKLIIEPGRYLINDSFFIISRIMSLKNVKNKIWYILDVGTNLLIPRPNAYFEVFPLINKNTKFYCSSFSDGICSSNSIISNNLYLPMLKINDLVLITNCGGYTYNLQSNFGYKKIEPSLL